MAVAPPTTINPGSPDPDTLELLLENQGIIIMNHEGTMKECDLVTVGHLFVANSNNLDLDVLVHEFVKPSVQGSSELSKKEKDTPFCVQLGNPCTKKEVDPANGSDKCHCSFACIIMAA